MSVMYAEIYFVIVMFILLCLFIRFFSGLIILFFLEKYVINKKNSNNILKMNLKSNLYGIIADAVTVSLNVIILNTFLIENNYFFVISGLCISCLILFVLDYIFIYKNINVTLTKKLVSAIILTLFTVNYLFHISFSSTYSLMI